jgi:hypothetical protein
MSILGNSSRPDYDDLTKVIIDETSSQVAAWAAVLCSVLGVIGNCLTVYVLLKKKSLRQHSTTPFLLSLALSDLLFSAFNLPLMAVRFFEKDWIFCLFTCKLFPFFFYANISMSAFSMALVALNRYVGVYYPNRMYYWFSTFKSIMAVITLWAISFGLMMLPFTKVVFTRISTMP